jgi:hypothetical protein
MRAEIEQRIRAVYPTGRLEEPDIEQYLGDAYDKRIWKLLVEATQQTAVQVDANWAPETKQHNRYAFTFDADPCFLEWVHSPRQEKLQIIAERGRNVPVFWLSVSRIFPTYNFYYNIWKPRGDTGYLDTEITYSPFDSGWAVFHERLFSILGNAGLERLSENEWYEEVPFVLDVEFDDDDDDDEFDDEGHLVPVNVYCCLFGGP